VGEGLTVKRQSQGRGGEEKAGEDCCSTHLYGLGLLEGLEEFIESDGELRRSNE
jgi:hypothetical protein